MPHLGLRISPDRLLDISTNMGNKAIAVFEKGGVAVFEKEGVVCPLNLRHDFFTTTATDKLDVNPSSATAMTAFHGIATSLNQHICGGYFGCPCDIPDALTSDRFVKNLPEKLTNVKLGYLPHKVPMCKVNSGGKASASKDFQLS